MCQSSSLHQQCALPDLFPSVTESFTHDFLDLDRGSRHASTLFSVPSPVQERMDEEYFDRLFLSPVLEGDARQSSSSCEQVAESFFASPPIEPSDGVGCIDPSLLAPPLMWGDLIGAFPFLDASFGGQASEGEGKVQGELVGAQGMGTSKNLEFSEHAPVLSEVFASSKISSENSLKFHEEYLVKRLEANPFATNARLFEEIKARGYQKSKRQAYAFLRSMRWKICPPRTRLPFHIDYLIKRLEEVPPPKQSDLLKEIKARGYLGSAKQLERVLYEIQKGKHCRAKNVFSSPEASLYFHQSYLMDRIKETELRHATLSGAQLFEEIKAKGYRGSLRHLQELVTVIRAQLVPPEAHLPFHKDYLTERLRGEIVPNQIKGHELFEEIKAKGYRGSLKSVQGLASAIRKDLSPSARLGFHKDYLIERIKGMQPEHIEGPALLAEIQARGYRGSLKPLQAFLTPYRQKIELPEMHPELYRDYLVRRLETSGADNVSIANLFEEIVAKGYLGSIHSLRAFLAKIRNVTLIPEMLHPYKGYFLKRLLETQSSVSAITLFEEIQAKGYQGSLNSVKIFLKEVREEKDAPQASLTFHKHYLIERVQRGEPGDDLSGPELFREIKERGYEGGLRNVQRFLATIRKEPPPSKAQLAFHVDYLIKRLNETQHRNVPKHLLFQEINERGYQGAFSHFSAFLCKLKIKMDAFPPGERGTVG